VREVLRNFVPTFVARGAVQISAYVDMSFASRLGTGPAAALGYAQQIYLLPVGLFGMSISAAALPEMSGTGADDEPARRALRAQLLGGLRKIAFFVVPSAVAFLALGDVVAGIILQTGAFTREQSLYTWAVLAGSGVGLLAATLGRLYSSTFYALRDTRTPLRLALVRIGLSIALGWLFAFPLPAAAGLSPRWGAAGLTTASSVAGWVEFALLRRALGRRIGETAVPLGQLATVWIAAVLAAALAWGAKLLVGADRPLVGGVVVLGCFGLTYLGVTVALRVPEARGVVTGVLARLGRRRRAGAAAGGERARRGACAGRRRAERARAPRVRGGRHAIHVRRPRSRRREAGHPPRRARRLPLEGRRGEGAVRRQGQAPALARAELLRQRPPHQPEDARAGPQHPRAGDDRRPDGGARADPRGEPHQGVQAAASTSRCATTSRTRTSRSRPTSRIRAST
jgi:hypothetical protein